MVKTRWKNKTSFENRMRSILDIYVNFDDITISNNIIGEIGPFELAFIKHLFAVSLFLLEHNHILLHKLESITNALTFNRPL